MEVAKPLDWKAYPAAPDAGEAREYYGFFEFGYYVVTKSGSFWAASTFMNDGKAKHVGFYETLSEAKNAAESNYHSRLRSAFVPAPAEPVALTYTNWRGETAVRTLTPLYVWFGATEWHPDPQWLLHAIDAEKGPRDFALKDFGAPAALAEFANECLNASWGGWDLNGGDVQDTAERLGIIETVAFNPAVHYDRHGLTEPGGKWFVFTPAVAAYLKTVSQKDQS